MQHRLLERWTASPPFERVLALYGSRPRLSRGPKIAVRAGVGLAVAAALLVGVPRALHHEPPIQGGEDSLRDPENPVVEVEKPETVIGSAESIVAEEAIFPPVDPLTFLTPYADSVMVENMRSICETPAPEGALHVAPGGNDGNPGTEDQPLASIASAVSRAQPGQTVLVRGGEYRQTVTISGKSGTADAYITLRSYPGEQATIVSDISQNAISLRKGSSYINIACLELAGPTQRPEAVPSSPSVMRDQKLAGQSHPDQIPQNYGAGIDIGDQADTRNGQISHHIRVIGNRVHDYAEMGISAVEADHVTIVGNVSHHNAKYSCFSGSGIGLGFMVEAGGPPNPDGYKNYVVGNISYGNENRSLQCFTDGLDAVLTDGNGIILDLNDTNSYTGRTLVADNVLYGNGGRGILIFKSSHVDVVNNVTYENALTENLMGRSGPHPEIAISGDDVRVFNNIAIPREGNEAFKAEGSNPEIGSNLFGEPGDGTGLFAAPGRDESADFTVVPEAEALLQGGTPFLAGPDPEGLPAVLSPIRIGAVHNDGRATP